MSIRLHRQGRRGGSIQSGGYGQAAGPSAPAGVYVTGVSNQGGNVARWTFDTAVTAATGDIGTFETSPDYGVDGGAGTLAGSGSNYIDITYPSNPLIWDLTTSVTGVTFAGGKVLVIPQSGDVASTSQPTIQLNRLSVGLVCFEGGNPVIEQFTVKNVGTGTLSYSLTALADPAWLEIHLSGGGSLSNPYTSTGEADGFEIACASTNLPPGVYTGTITCDAPAASNSPQVMDVTLTVLALSMTILSATRDGPEVIWVLSDASAHWTGSDLAASDFVGWQVFTSLGWTDPNLVVVTGDGFVRLYYDGVFANDAAVRIVNDVAPWSNGRQVVDSTGTLGGGLTAATILYSPLSLNLSVAEGNNVSDQTILVVAGGDPVEYGVITADGA